MLDPARTFATFITSPASEQVVRIARSVVTGGRERPNPMLLNGPSSSGKTHLLHAIGNELVSCGRTPGLRLLSADTIANQYLDSILSSRVRELQHSLDSCSALLVDQLEDLQDRPATQLELFARIRALVGKGRTVVLATSLQLPALEEQVSSYPRGVMLRLRASTHEQRVRALRRAARTRGLHVSSDALDVLARRAQTIPEAAGLLERAVAERRWT